MDPSECLNHDPHVRPVAKEVGYPANVCEGIFECPSVILNHTMNDEEIVPDFIEDYDESPRGIRVHKLK